MMTLSKQVKIFSILIFASITVASFLYQQISTKLAKEQYIYETMGTKVQGVFELNIITAEHIDKPSKRTIQQWERRHASLTNTLLSLLKNQPEINQYSLDTIRLNLIRIRNLFFKIVVQEQRINPSKTPLLRSLKNQLLQLTQLVVFDINRLGKESLIELKKTQSSLNKLLQISIISLVLTILFMYLWFQRVVLQPIVKLKDYANTLINGDYLTKVSHPGENEIANSFSAFNMLSSTVAQKIDELTLINSNLNHEMEGRKRIEKHLQNSIFAVKESKKNLAHAQKISKLGSWELEHSSNQIHWSDEVYQIFEIGKNEFNATYDAFLEAIHPDDKEKVNIAFSESLKSHQPYSIVHRLLLKNEQIKHVEENCTTVFDEHGTPIISKGTIQDITNHINIQHELLSAKKEAEQANFSKSHFLANMSHELRTPMHGILSYARMGIKRYDSNEPEKLLRFFTNINTSGNRLMVLLNDLLDIAKLESGKMILNKTRSILASIISGCLLEQEERIKENKQSIDLSKAKFSGKAYFDSARIGQVVTNLLSNAIKFTPRETSIDFAISESLITINHIEQKALLLSVRDHGSGIPEGEEQVIFEKFAQSSDTTVATTHGTGLGLPICKEIIHLHKGEIWAENHPQGGAIFNVLIPVELDDNEASE